MTTPLTPREAEVLAAYHRTHSRREVGRALGVSELTVKRHLENARRKLGTRDSWAAYEEAVAHGLL